MKQSNKLKQTEIGKIPNNWKVKTISEVCSNIIDCSHARKPIFPEKGNHIFLEVNNIGNDGFLNLSEVKYVSEDDFQAWTKRLTPKHKDIVITKTGRVGAVAMVPEGISCCLGRNQVLLRPDTNMIVPEFLLYYLLSPAFKSELKRLSLSGTILESLHVKYIPELRLPYPEKSEQLEIADVLLPLYEKEILNEEMNKTLGSIAQTIFKHWFVDFEFSNEDGKPYKSSGGTMMASEMGKVPNGWTVGSLRDLITQRSERVGTRKVVVLSALANGTLVRSDVHFTKRVYSKKITKYLLVEQWDFAYNPSRINIGSIGMLENEVLGGVSPVYVVFRPVAAYRWFLKFLIYRANTQTWINTLASGSVRQSLSYTNFASIPCVIPPERIVLEFNRLWTILREGIRSSEKESNTLRIVRSTILPKLVSGEIRV